MKIIWRISCYLYKSIYHLHLRSWSHPTLYNSCTAISCLYLLCKLTAVFWLGDSDKKNYLQNLLTEVEIGSMFLGSPLLKICWIHILMVVSCFKTSFVNEMCTEEEIHKFLLHAALQACFLNSHQYGCLWFYLLASIVKCSLAVCQCVVCVKQQVSIIPILLKTSSVYYPNTPVIH
jgi:hypothetical protein